MDWGQKNKKFSNLVKDELVFFTSSFSVCVFEVSELPETCEKSPTRLQSDTEHNPTRTQRDTNKTRPEHNAARTQPDPNTTRPDPSRTQPDPNGFVLKRLVQVRVRSG